MPQSSPNSFSGIFICYRRADCEFHAGQLFDKLVERFGPEHVFMDRESLGPGEVFSKVIENAVGSCSVLIAMIGSDWLSIGEAKSWKDNARDFIRLEIGAVLGRDIPVIPVLVRGANMPTANQLPKELESLPERHYFELSDRRWSRDVVDLIAYLEKILDGKTSPNDSDSLTEARSAARSLGGKRGITERRATADPHKVSRTRRVWPVVAVVAGLVILGTVFLILWNMQRPLSLAENVAKGRELSSLKRYSEAERYWRAAIDQDSYNPEYHNALGVALFFQKRYPESEGYLRKALSYNQGNAQYFADLGNALNSQAKYAEAEPEHRKAVDLDPKTGFMNMLGLDLFFQKKYAEAEEWFRKALATNADQAEIQNNLGNALYFQKNYKEARQHYEKARSLQPENTYFQENVKKSILRIEQPDLAP